MLPPMIPFLHDAFWFGLFAGLALFAWKAAERYDLRLSGLDWRRPARDSAAAATASWFTATTARSSGNSAFDDWRDGELARIELQRRALETRLRAFERFVETLKRAQDRATFDRFMAEAPEMTEGAAVNPIDHRPASPQS